MVAKARDRSIARIGAIATPRGRTAAFVRSRRDPRNRRPYGTALFDTRRPDHRSAAWRRSAWWQEGSRPVSRRDRVPACVRRSSFIAASLMMLIAPPPLLNLTRTTSRPSALRPDQCRWFPAAGIWKPRSFRALRTVGELLQDHVDRFRKVAAGVWPLRRTARSGHSELRPGRAAAHRGSSTRLVAFGVEEAPIRPQVVVEAQCGCHADDTGERSPCSTRARAAAPESSRSITPKLPVWKKATSARSPSVGRTAIEIRTLGQHRAESFLCENRSAVYWPPRIDVGYEPVAVGEGRSAGLSADAELIQDARSVEDCGGLAHLDDDLVDQVWIDDTACREDLPGRSRDRPRQL